MSDSNLSGPYLPRQFDTTLLSLALLIAVLIAFAKFYLIAHGGLEIGTEGDEGVRIQIAGRLASSWSDIFGYLVDKWAAIHPPGDMAIRAAFFKVMLTVAPALPPVPAALYFSCTLSLIGALLLTVATFRAGGGLAALLFSILLATSWQFHNPSLSGMGEGTMFVFFAAEICLLVEALLRNSWRWLIVAAVAGLIASLMRPEPVFLLPGLCLALWYAVGFFKAAVFGSIASSYLVAKSIIPPLFTPDAITIFNFSKLYTFTGMPLWKFQYSKFGQGLLNDHFFGAFWLLLLGIALGGLLQWRDFRHAPAMKRTDLVSVTIVAAALLYLVLTITAVLTGKTANSSVRLGYLPSYLLQMAASLGVARFVQDRFGTQLGVAARRLWAAPMGYGAAALAIAVLSIGAGVVAEAKVIAKRGHNRAPLDALAVRDWVLSNTKDGEGLFLDRMWNRENWMVGYLARRSDVCAYFACPVEAPPLKVARPPGEVCGVHGLACLYRRTQVYIKAKKPRWFVSLTGKLSNRWLGVQHTVYGKKDGTALWSFIYPYSVPAESGTEKPGATNTAFVTRRMTLEDGYSFTLKPHFTSGDFVVYEAMYNEPPK